MDCSVIIPVYNSQKTLAELVAELDRALPTVSQNFEVILVNDGSHDQSWETIRQLAQKNSWVRGINLMRNYGQHNALLAGIRTARYEATITMDDDLQHPPDQIPTLLQALDADHDLVYGTAQVLQHGLWRDLTSQITKLILQSAMGVRNAPAGSSFRAFRTKLRDAFAHYESPYVAIDVLLSWGTTRLGFVPVRHDPRRLGRSTYNFVKLLILAIDLTTGFSTWPLRIATLIGFGFTVFGSLLLAYVLLLYALTGTDVSIYRFVASVVAIFSGAQLFTLGIIGEYLARMYFRIIARPTYVIREETKLE